MSGLASALLSFAHSLFGPGICPGDWVWATSTAGALVALFPAAGALIVAIVRKGTGNRYDAVTLSVFGLIGVLSAFLLPWLLSIPALGLSIYGWYRQRMAATGGIDPAVGVCGAWAALHLLVIGGLLRVA